MAKVLIRQAGPYTISIEGGGYLYCNDKAVTWEAVEGRADGVIALVDTRCKGANGKPDLVGLKAEHMNIIKAEIAAYQARIDAKISPEHIARLNELGRRAAAHDRLYNEGAEGYNPYHEKIEVELRATANLTREQLAEVAQARADDADPTQNIFEPQLAALSDEDVYAQIVAERTLGEAVARRDAAELAEAFARAGLHKGSLVKIKGEDIVWEVMSARRWEGGILLQLYASEPYVMFSDAMRSDVTVL